MIWQLWRQGDNGNRFMVGEFESGAAAERMIEELTRYPHKQIYWIEAPVAANGERGTGAG